MGVLDDAIREHLDLKRRHGVAEEELRRQEEEALGPARREVAPAETDDGNGTGEDAPAELEAAETADVHPDVETAVEEAHADEPEPVGQETAPYDVPAEEFEAEALPEEPEALHEERGALHEERGALDEEPAVHEEAPVAGRADEAPLPAGDGFEEDEDERPRAGDTPPQGFEALDDEFEEDDQPAGEGEEAGDDPDLLEDTPDFLQETPEHDRLWFEQKPPRDFDFD